MLTLRQRLAGETEGGGSEIAMKRRIITATVGQTSLDLGGDTYTPGFVDVYQNGALLVPGDDFTASDGTSITLSSPATAGDNIVVIAYDSFTVADAATPAYVDFRVASAIDEEEIARNTAIQDAINDEVIARNNAIAALPIPGKEKFVATGTLPDGTAVVLNADGTVSAVTGNPDTTGTATVFRSTTTSFISSASLSSTSVVVVFYDGTNTQAVIGTISGTSVSFGTPVTIIAGYVPVVCALSSTSFAVALTNSTNGRGVVGTVSGTTITFGTIVTFNAASTGFPSIAALSSTAVVIAYQDTGAGGGANSIIGTISGTTITFGSEYLLSGAGTTTAISVTALSSTAFVSSFSVSSQGYAAACSVSGTTISVGVAVSFDTTALPSYTSIVALTSTTFIVAWARSTTDGRAKIGSVSGTTVSFPGSDVVFNAAATYFMSAAKFSAETVCLTYQDGGNSFYGTVAILDISGSTISPRPEVVFRSASTSHIWASVVDGKLFIGYREQDLSAYGTGVVFQPAGSNVADWEGITASLINNGTQGYITIRGGIASNLSGLTPKADYYLTNNGTLTTTVTPYKVGRALSATKLRISGNA